MSALSQSMNILIDRIDGINWNATCGILRNSRKNKESKGFPSLKLTRIVIIPSSLPPPRSLSLSILLPIRISLSVSRTLRAISFRAPAPYRSIICIRVQIALIIPWWDLSRGRSTVRVPTRHAPSNGFPGALPPPFACCGSTAGSRLV